MVKWHLYRLLQQTVTQYPREIAVLVLPVPLHPACNSAVRAEPSQNAQACEFARLFLAMWQTAPKEFPEFSHWLMAARLPPAFPEARNKAQRAAGSTAISLVLLDGRIYDRVKQAVELYQTLAVDKLPQILLADRMIVGRMDSLKELHAVIRLAPSDPAKTQCAITNKVL